MGYQMNPRLMRGLTGSSKKPTKGAERESTAGAATEMPPPGDLESLMPESAPMVIPEKVSGVSDNEASGSGGSSFTRRHTIGDPRITVASAASSFRLKKPVLQDPKIPSPPVTPDVGPGYFGAMLDKVRAQPDVVKAAGGAAALLGAVGVAGALGAPAVLAGSANEAESHAEGVAEDTGVERLTDDLYVDADVVADVLLQISGGEDITLGRVLHTLHSGDVLAMEYHVDDDTIEDMCSAIALASLDTALGTHLFPDLAWKYEARPGLYFGGGFCGYVDESGSASAIGCLISFDESVVYLQRRVL